jgi:tetratricopeptide (TPR) repeat protein
MLKNEKMNSKKKINKKEIKWLIKGLSLDINGKYKEAIECYDKALEINPESADALNNKGAALDDIGKYEEAIECYEKALKLNPQHSDALYNKTQSLNEIKLKKLKKKVISWREEGYEVSDLEKIID